MVSRLEEVKNAKIEKYNELKKAKYDPYTIEKFDKQIDVEGIRKKHDSVKTSETSKETVKTAGRIMIIRGHGKLFFMDLQDGSGKMQIVIRQDATKNFEDIKYLGTGDFVGVEGKITRTNSGELSIVVANFQILSKNILPLPEKWHGLVDEEERLRKRYLDILMNPEIREIFVKKAKFWNTIRQFLLERDFLEVETPVLETSAGGASATPFKTHHNALNIDVFLRISMGELWQKKLMVAGFEKTFEIGRQFRNEGMDIEHLQDYTQMEFYWAYADYKDGMKLVEEMYKKIAKDVFGTTKFETHGYTVDFSKNWEIFDYESTIKKHTGIDIYKADEKEIKKKLTELKIEFDPNVDKWRLVDILWKFCRKKLSGPGFLTNQPVEISPLAKRDPKDKRKVHQFQVIIAGSEIGNGYSELNDPFDQDERFKKQQEMKTKGDTEAQDHDFSFVEALQYGMPPTCGFGVSERLFSFLMDKPIRECVIFPLMRPIDTKPNVSSESKENKNINVSISKELAEKYPGIKFGYLFVELNKIEKQNPKLTIIGKAVISEIKNHDLNYFLKDKNILSWLNQYKIMGLNPAKIVPAQVEMIKKITSGKEFPNINTIVDLANITACQSKLPVGAFDLDKINGDISLRLSKKDEKYLPLGEKNYENIPTNEIVYADEKIIFSRYSKDCDITKITPNTKNVFYVIDGTKDNSKEEIQKYLNELEKILTTALGAKVIKRDIITTIIEDKKVETKTDRKLSITRDKAWKFVLKHNSEKYDLNHYLESEAVMKALAKKLGEDEDYFGMLGLLHDVDWGETKKDSTKHLTLAPKLLKELGLNDEFISIVLSHGYGYDCADLKEKTRTKKIEHALACSETITGLIHSYYLMRKSFDGMKAKGLMEKFKDSKFAAKIDRNAIKECELVGVPLAEFMQLSIDAIAGIKDKLNL